MSLYSTPCLGMMSAARLLVMTVLLLGLGACQSGQQGRSEQLQMHWSSDTIGAEVDHWPVTIIDCTAPSRLAVSGDVLAVSSFHAGQVTFFAREGNRHLATVGLDTFAFKDPVSGETEMRSYAGGDLVLLGDKAFVAQVFSDYVLVIDIPTAKITARIPVGGYGKFAQAPDAQKMYYACNRKQVFYSIDPQTYSFETVPYPPGGKGIGAAGMSSDGTKLYLGIQRGGRMPGDGGGGSTYSFVAVYDIIQGRYIAQTLLTTPSDGPGWENAFPADFLTCERQSRLYVGMFQCLSGIKVIDSQSHEVVDAISFTKSHRNTYFKRPDSLSLAFYGDWLLVVNRCNAELAILDRTRSTVLLTIDLGREMAQAAPMVLDGHVAYVGHPERNALIRVDLRLLKQQLEEKARAAGVSVR